MHSVIPYDGRTVAPLRSISISSFRRSRGRSVSSCLVQCIDLTTAKEEYKATHTPETGQSRHEHVRKAKKVQSRWYWRGG